MWSERREMTLSKIEMQFVALKRSKNADNLRQPKPLYNFHAHEWMNE